MGPSFTRPRFATVVYHNGPCNKSGIPENEALPRKQGWGRAVCKSHTTPREQPFTRGGGGQACLYTQGPQDPAARTNLSLVSSANKNGKLGQLLHSCRTTNAAFRGPTEGTPKRRQLTEWVWACSSSLGGAAKTTTCNR